MKTYRASAGPFKEQPFFKADEIEMLCVDELVKAGLYPGDPAPIRIDRFIEKRFQLTPSYEDLPHGLLGFTRFNSHGIEAIVVAKALDDEGTQTAERRLRTTLAHEGGHGLLHAYLFVLGERPDSLFGDGLDPTSPKILCRDGAVPGVMKASPKKPPYRWWEYQANQAMAALLLPKGLLGKALGTTLVHAGTLGLPTLPPERREQAARLLADVFDVNPVVARLRLEALYPAAGGSQLTL